MANASITESSLVIKELSNGTSPSLYAMLYKSSESEYADGRGWVWGYVFPNDDVATTTEDKALFVPVVIFNQTTSIIC